MRVSVCVYAPVWKWVHDVFSFSYKTDSLKAFSLDSSIVLLVSDS